MASIYLAVSRLAQTIGHLSSTAAEFLLDAITQGYRIQIAIF